LRRERRFLPGARRVASRSKSRLLAAASHCASRRTRCPLFGREPRTIGIARNIEVTVESLDNLFEALSDLSRLDAGVIVPTDAVNVRPLFERLQNEFQPQAALRPVMGPSPDLWIHTDPVLLSAYFATCWRTPCAIRKAAAYACCAPSRRTVGACCDSGNGVPLAEQDRIFEEFYQLNNL
jgi:signal transduction histidine kinase